MNANPQYEGIGCPDCGPEADIEGGSITIDGENAYQNVYCLQCKAEWRNGYRFAAYTFDAAAGQAIVVRRDFER